MLINCKPLGQSGFRLEMNDTVVYIDPYLSDSVEKEEGPHQKRLLPIPVQAGDIPDADFVLITHIHLDHCDLETLAPLAKASPQCIFFAPGEVRDYLLQNGFSNEQVRHIQEGWHVLSNGLRIHQTPAAHPTTERDERGNWKYIGYIIEFEGRKIYHAGDTFLTKELVDFMEDFKPLSTAILPVNEHNYARGSIGIIGNMGLRDAFEFASILEVEKMVPIHWDMFASNTVFREEIELLYKLIQPPFELVINPTSL
jgi:L-ascorbate 6-phosphate lactonase